MKRTFGIALAAVTFGLMMTTGGAAFGMTPSDPTATSSASAVTTATSIASAVATSTINLSVVATADGSPGVSTGAGFSPASLLPGATTTMQMGTTTPANICRTEGTCAAGYPNSGAVLTISGLEAPGLTFVGNGDTSAGCVQSTADTVVCHYQYFNNYHKSDRFTFTTSSTSIPGDYTITAALHLFDKTPPTAKSQCKEGGWVDFHDALYNPIFKNQGDCVSFVAAGRNS